MGGTFFVMGKISVFMSALIGCTIVTVEPLSAGTNYDSSVRRAAIAQMQKKLGTIRGSIAGQTTDVLLTESMLERWKPIRSRASVQVASNAPQKEVKSAPQAAPVNPAESGKLYAQPDFKAEPTAKELLDALDRRIVADSLPATSPRSVLPSTSDIDEIMKAVDAMTSTDF